MGSQPPSTLLVVATVCAWFVANISVLLLNKSFLTKSFRQPFTLTLLHMASAVVFSLIAARFGAGPPLRPLTSQRQVLKVLLLAILFCFTVSCLDNSLTFSHRLSYLDCRVHLPVGGSSGVTLSPFVLAHRSQLQT